MLLVLADAAASSIPLWLQILLGSGLLVVVLPALAKQTAKFRDRRRSMKTAPVLKDAKAITQLQGDMKRVNGWLLGNKDPFTGEYVGDGFKDTFPVFQREVLNRLKSLQGEDQK